jgi:hypothetical protein
MRNGRSPAESARSGKCGRAGYVLCAGRGRLPKAAALLGPPVPVPYVVVVCRTPACLGMLLDT